MEPREAKKKLVWKQGRKQIKPKARKRQSFNIVVTEAPLLSLEDAENERRRPIVDVRILIRDAVREQRNLVENIVYEINRRNELDLDSDLYSVWAPRTKNCPEWGLITRVSRFPMKVYLVPRMDE